MEVQCFDMETEADNNDITLCPHDDKPSTGMFAAVVKMVLRRRGGGLT